MATAVLDLELENFPSEMTGLEKYGRAQVLIRFSGKPVGQTLVPVTRGRLGGDELRDAVLKTVDWAFWECWLQKYLGLEHTGSMNPLPPVSIAVCTRDRPSELRQCLEALTRLPDDGQEMMVIDNCPSTDSTFRLVKDWGRVRYVREDTPGLNSARNRALREAQHEIVAFLDDDAVPEPGWLRALASNFQETLVLCVTGLTMPLELETEAQEWFERYSPFQRGFRKVRYHRNSLDPLRASRVGAGANMALRRSLPELVGPFDEALDAGTPTRSGGDTEMFYRILAAGYDIIYEPAALVRHRHRSTWKDLCRTIFGYGVGTYAFWTRSLVFGGEWGVAKLAWNWFSRYQLRDLLRSLLKRPDSKPLDLLIAELRGCAAGPWAYFVSRRAVRRRKSKP